VSNWAIVAVVARNCRWTFVAATIADRCGSVAATVASSWPLSLVSSRALVAVRVASNWVASAVSVWDANT